MLRKFHKKLFVNVCNCLSGGGKGGSWSSLWFWTPHVSLWTETVWTQEWTFFLSVKSNANTLVNTVSVFYNQHEFFTVCAVLLDFQVESFMEARLWNNIFVWTQQKVSASPRACLLFVDDDIWSKLIKFFHGVKHFSDAALYETCWMNLLAEGEGRGKCPVVQGKRKVSH